MVIRFRPSQALAVANRLFWMQFARRCRSGHPSRKVEQVLKYQGSEVLSKRMSIRLVGGTSILMYGG